MSQSENIIINQGDTLRIQPIGDSITRGTEGDTYRNYLKTILSNNNIEVNFVGECINAAASGSVWSDYPDLFNLLEGDIEHDGYGGLRINQLTDMTYNTRGYPKKTIEQLVKDNPSDILLLMIGTNDIVSNYELPTVASRFDTIISRILRSADGHLIVSTIPPTPLPIANGKIQALNSVIFPIVDSLKQKGENISFKDINSMMTNDGISSDSYHPNSKGYEMIATGWYEAISDIVTGVKAEKKNNKIPAKFGLNQNYPNPFNPETIITFSIPEISFVSLKVYDMLGKEVDTIVSETKSIGEYEVNFNASKLTSGVYFYRLSTASLSDTKRMILIK
jgi:lysophospholipase L1-like esterase